MARSSFIGPYRRAIDVLIEARKSVGVTQTVLAERLAKPQSFVAKFEGLERRLNVIEYIAVADALDVPRATICDQLLRVLPDKLEI